MQSIDSELIPGLLPRNEVSILAGASGAGKTTLLMQLIRELVAGRPAFGFEAKPDLSVGYIAADRSWQSYLKTAAMVDLDLEKVAVRTLIDDPSIDIKEFEASPIQELERLIGTLLPRDLIVVDPLVVFLGVDTNKYHLNAARLIRLNKLCQANKVTLLGTHHAAKARTDVGYKRAQDRISGSAALLGFTSTQLFLASPEETERDDHYTEWHVVSHHAPHRVILLGRGEDGRFIYEGEDSARPISLADRIVLFLAEVGEPVATGDILNHTIPSGASKRQVERALTNLREAGVVKSSIRGSYELAPAGS